MYILFYWMTDYILELVTYNLYYTLYLCKNIILIQLNHTHVYICKIVNRSIVGLNIGALNKLKNIVGHSWYGLIILVNICIWKEYNASFYCNMYAIKLHQNKKCIKK